MSWASNARAQGSAGDMLALGAGVIKQEAEALQVLAQQLDAVFSAAVEHIVQCQGRLVVTGIGKSGHIARKIAATFASTGTPALFVHPAEASHGDLGMIEDRDTVLAISKSGESPELSHVVGYCVRHRITLVAITAERGSTLGRAASLLLTLPALTEACPLGVAPTTSTTMTLALGDALAVACLQRRGFRAANFREFHPGGKLGQRMKWVRDIMHAGPAVPVVDESATVGAAILEMTRARLGCVGIVNAERQLVGIFTDGDLRRSFCAAIVDTAVSQVMTPRPQQVSPDTLVADVAYLLSSKRIPSVFVTESGCPVGIVHVHDLLGCGYL